jgi:hypothetical protein
VQALNYDLATVRRHFDRVTSQGPTRFQTCSFLAGITFAAFAARLAGKPVPFPGDLPTTGQLAIDSLLGAATIALLLATMGAYGALHDLAEIAAPRADGSDYASWPIIEDCYCLYHRSGNLLVAAVSGIMVSLLILGFYVSVLVGLSGVLALVLSLRYLRLSSRVAKAVLASRIVSALLAWWRKRARRSHVETPRPS